MNKPRHAASAEFYDAVIYTCAALIVIVFHALLLGVFTARKPQEAKKTSERKTISMLAVNSPDISRNKSLLDSLECWDPTLFAKPNETYGFSALNKKKFSAKPLGDQSGLDDYKGSLEGGFGQPGIYQFSWKNDTLPHPGTISSDVAEAPVKSSGPARRKEYPFCSDSYGKELKEIVQANDQLREKIKLLNPKNSTAFLVILNDSDFIPRLKLTDSCGFFELDSLAMRSFMAYHETLNLKKVKSARQYGVTVEWQQNTVKVADDTN